METNIGTPKRLILCDTGVFFELFHQNPEVCRELDHLGFGRLLLSSVSVAEAYYGMKTREIRKTRELVRRFSVYHIDKEISQRFLQLMLAYPNHRVALPDALIAATALVANVELFTLNRKDFDYIEGIRLYKPKFAKTNA
jgi:tRNA(fMet)-specific endonuclease VapC